MYLEGKIAVVTGGSSGIGLAIAKRFVAEGAYVFIVGRRQQFLDDAVRQVGPNIEAIAGDMTMASDVARLFSAVRERKGKLDILVVNSGNSEFQPLPDITEEHFSKIFDLNVRAAVFVTKEALQLLRPGAKVLLVGSIAGYIGTKGYSSYNASKAALRSFARTWANELAPQGIRVNVLSPGPTDTPMFDGVSDEVRAALTAKIPLGRLGKPEEIAAAALFLTSDESSYITGAELSIDGGAAQV